MADSIDTRTAAGRLVLNVLLSVAQWERETTGERCGKLRFGYDLADDGKTLVPNGEQDAIVLMLRLRAAGCTLRQIAAQLTDQGIPTKAGGAVWTHTAVGRILNRKVAA